MSQQLKKKTKEQKEREIKVRSIGFTYEYKDRWTEVEKAQNCNKSRRNRDRKDRKKAVHKDRKTNIQMERKIKEQK